MVVKFHILVFWVKISCSVVSAYSPESMANYSLIVGQIITLNVATILHFITHPDDKAHLRSKGSVRWRT
jgi:hypothetical protein